MNTFAFKNDVSKYKFPEISDLKYVQQPVGAQEIYQPTKNGFHVLYSGKEENDNVSETK